MIDHEKDIELLSVDIDSIVVKYQHVIKQVISRFIFSGSINSSDLDDFAQIVNEKLLLKSDIIRSQYQGISLFKTYLISIIRNICIDEINRGKKIAHVELEESIHLDLVEEPFYDVDYIDIEFKRLRRILQMYNSKKFN